MPERLKRSARRHFNAETRLSWKSSGLPTRVSQASVIKRERIVKKRLRIKRPKERSRGLGALATELALKAHRAFNLSKLTLRVAFARTMLRSSRS
ncbi:hypothetical protein HMPREF0424_0295 [Gardnerella vaginalis 409-05]|nr:hypothetical protein HMPREF0424_0295 [Gardnerella vaginalis 409-05]